MKSNGGNGLSDCAAWLPLCLSWKVELLLREWTHLSVAWLGLSEVSVSFAHFPVLGLLGGILRGGRQFLTIVPETI